MESDGPTEFGTSPACTLYDVAREAGVSTATVSRVVHGQDRVHPTTRRRGLEGIEALVGHMVEQPGNARFLYIAGPPEVFDARERRTAFGEALAEHPGVTLAGIFEGKFAGLSGQLAVREMLTWPRRARPDAIVCAND